MGQFICLVFCFWLKEKPNSQLKLLWYCWVQVFREVAKNCRRKVRSRRGRSSADRSWMLATSRYRIIIKKKTHAYTLLHTHTYTYTKKNRKDGVSFGVFGFLYLRFLLLLIFWKECGGVYKTGRRRIGWAAPSLGARKEMLTSSLSFRLFFYLHFPFHSLYPLPSFLGVFVMSFGTGSVVAGSSAHPHAFCFHWVRFIFLGRRLLLS